MLLGNVIRGFHGGVVLLGNFIEVVLGCGWWHYARGKCTQRVANRIVMVVLRWVWVVGLRLCTRGKYMHQVANRIVNVGVKVASVEVLRTRDF